MLFKYNLFAGTACWKKAEGKDKKIICGKLEGGEVKYGDVEEIGLPKEEKEGDAKVIELNGKKYKLIS